jgi:hypothetical protein
MGTTALSSPSNQALTQKSIPNKQGCGWEKLPYEMREKIFGEVEADTESYFTWKGSVPALVVALRPLKLSYEHVLEWFENETLYFASITTRVTSFMNSTRQSGTCPSCKD